MSEPLPRELTFPQFDVPRDALSTVASIALLAYLAADLIHHALGHGVMCWAQGGQIKLLSSVVLVCSRTGVAIDVAGPLANLACGALAVLGLRRSRALSAPAELFWTLFAAFNLMWFAGQLFFNAMTVTDDWEWMLHALGDPPLLRYGLIAAGATLYVLTTRQVGSRLAAFAQPPARIWLLVGTAWLTAGALAAATAAFDRHGLAQLWRHALPQSLLLPAGLLLVPRHALQTAGPAAQARAALCASWGWLVTAAVAGLLSVALLGRGMGFLT